MKVLKLYCLLTLTVFSSATAQIEKIDIKLLRYINHNSTSGGFFEGITQSLYHVPPVAPIILIAVGEDERNVSLQRKGVVNAITVTTSFAVTIGLKEVIKRSRPYETYPDIKKLTKARDGKSFPSGHSSTAFAAATMLSLQYPKWYVIVPSYLWAGTVSYSRMHLGVHYPSDVLAGALVGAGISLLGYKIDQGLRKRKKERYEKYFCLQ